MSLPYEAPAAPRFVAEYKSGGEEIRIGASRHVFVSLFLAIWLCGWTTGGFSAIRMLAAIGFQPFLTLWLCGWALGEGFVLLTLAWMLRGSEVIRIAGEDLEIRAELFCFVKRRVFRARTFTGFPPLRFRFSVAADPCPCRSSSPIGMGR
jgi:hypothetical protein